MLTAQGRQSEHRCQGGDAKHCCFCDDDLRSLQMPPLRLKKRLEMNCVLLAI